MIQTSYFALYKGPNAVSIALKTPTWYGLCDTYPKLFPHWSFLKQYKQDKNEEAYVEQYYSKVLNKLDPQQVYEELDGKTLLCWEKSGEFCHRRLVAEWLEKNLGVQVPEYTPYNTLF